MTTERFNVVLEGTTLHGHDVATVETELARLIKRDADFAKHLLRGQPTKLKSGIDGVTGARYIEALERIGVAVRLESETIEVDSDLSAPPTPAKDKTRNLAKTESARADKSGFEPKGATLPWPRLWARQIDLALCSAIAIGVALLVGATPLLATTNIFVQWAVGLLWFALVLIGYETVSLVVFGTTLGKTTLGLRVETRSGKKIELGRAVRRTLSVWLLGSWAYLFFPVVTLIAWWNSRRRLQRTGSTPWDDWCVTRVAGGPVPAWRATLGGVIAVVAFALVFGLNAAGLKEKQREAQASIDRSYGLLPSSPAKAALSNKSTFDPTTARLDTEIVNPLNDPKTPVGPFDDLLPHERFDPVGKVSAMQPSARGQGETQDYAAQVARYRAAAEQGKASAQTGLAFMYDMGRGVRQDYTEAIKWYRKAAEQGDAIAQFDIGFMYANGHGVATDRVQAAQWYRKSAEQGDALSQHELGALYANGQGVPQNDIEAYKWFSLAITRYLASETRLRAEAVRHLDIVATRMTTAQITDAERLTREWRPK